MRASGKVQPRLQRGPLRVAQERAALGDLRDDLEDYRRWWLGWDEGFEFWDDLPQVDAQIMRWSSRPLDVDLEFELPTPPRGVTYTFAWMA